eukprot:1190420-Prorocentrum_minimum.AAC.4
MIENQVRPLSEDDQQSQQEMVWSFTDKTIVGKDPDRQFTFDGVFGPEGTNQVINRPDFELLGFPLSSRACSPNPLPSHHNGVLVGEAHQSLYCGLTLAHEALLKWPPLCRTLRMPSWATRCTWRSY